MSVGWKENTKKVYIKLNFTDYRDDSVIKSTAFSSEWPGFNSQNQFGQWQSSVTQVLG